MNKFKFVLIIITYLSICAYSECPSDFNERISNSDFNILFIGNSLTYTNDLPYLVKKTAKLRGIIIRTKMIAFPNYAIEDHWNNGEVQKLIASKKYDFVIIQQGPSSMPDGRKMLIEYGEKYSALCKNNNAKLSYFMVWPSRTYYHTFKGVINNYRDAANVNSAILCPVGEIWKDYFERTNNFDYYGSDGFHPSPKGSQVAADVIVEYLFREGAISE
jgi:hypothetical protein